MNNDYRYQLETRRLTGRPQQKFQCPRCGKKKCFVRYVDTRDGFRYVADGVGKCDHRHSCGYHYTPADYRQDHQWLTLPAQPRGRLPRPLPPPPPFQPLPMEYVLRSHSTRSTFWQWLSTHAAGRLGLTAEALTKVYEDYLVGATRRGHVIFWQIDRQRQVHAGHIMQYRTDGHRHGYQGWTHTALLRQGLLPEKWQLRQCHFGEHLLTARPADHVCLVESEKTALVMAALHPEHLWLATAGCSGLSPERMESLRGRRVTLFPDSGLYDEWSEKMLRTTGISYNVSRTMEAYPRNSDLCDLLPL